jgi:hypothetical protein
VTEIAVRSNLVDDERGAKRYDTGIEIVSRSGRKVTGCRPAGSMR